MCVDDINGHFEQIYGWNLVHMTEEFFLGDLNCTFNLPIGNHYQTPNTVNPQFFSKVLTTFKDAVNTCLCCLQQNIKCEYFCIECNDQQRLCVQCQNSTYNTL